VDLKALQKPLKERYRNEPGSSRITLTARGNQAGAPIGCSVDIGRVRPAPTRHDLDEVLTAVAQGQKLEPRSTPAVGCLIADVTR